MELSRVIDQIRMSPLSLRMATTLPSGEMVIAVSWREEVLTWTVLSVNDDKSWTQAALSPVIGPCGHLDVTSDRTWKIKTIPTAQIPIRIATNNLGFVMICL